MRGCVGLSEILDGNIPLPENYTLQAVVQDIFALTCSMTVTINSHRLQTIHPDLKPNKSGEAGLVSKAALLQLEAQKRVEKTFRPFFRYRPYPVHYGKGKGKGKGQGYWQGSWGRGKGGKPSSKSKTSS